MIRAALLFLSLAIAPSAMAETVRVLSGEHTGFTRLAFVFERPTEWEFGRIDPVRGQTDEPSAEARLYEIRLSRGDIDLNISDVFDRVPRTRLTNLAVQPGGRLRLSVAPGNRAVPFTLREGVVVIDIRTGPPPADSPFENRLARDTTGASQPIDSAATAAVGVTSTIGDIRFWSNYIRRRWAATLSEARPTGPQRLLLQQPPTVARYEPDPVDLFGSVLPGGLQTDASLFDSAAPHGADAAMGGSAPRLGPRRSMALTEPARKTVGVDIDRAQKLIVEQVARAAAQGLVTAVEPDLPERTGLSGKAASGPSPLMPDPPPSPTPQINVTAQTSMDRDGFTRVRQALLGQEHGCPDPATLNVAAWGRGEEPARLIAGGRAALLGEFDRVQDGAVADLARRYLYLGFGAETAALIRAFPQTIANEDRLLTLAAIMEGHPPKPGTPMLNLAHCDGATALWSLLSRNTGTAVPELNVTAVQRSFSDLPEHLRTYLAPALAERLIALGQIEAAAGIRNALRRLTAQPVSRADVIEARLSLDTDALETRTFTEREERLLQVIEEDGPDAIPALSLYLDRRLARDLPVTASFAERTAALAFTHRNAADGPALMRAEVLAQADAGNFAAAFSALGRATARAGAQTGPMRPALQKTIDPLFDLLTRKAPDVVFLGQVFGPARKSLGQSDVSHETVAQLSERLLALGFPAKARQVLKARGGRDTRSRLVLARSELALGNGQEALRVLDGRGGTEEARLRARAMMQVGETAKAIRIFDAAGDRDAAARTAWLAGDWATYQQLRPDARSAAISRLVLSRQAGSTASMAAESAGPETGNVAAADEAPATGAPRARIDATIADGAPETSVPPATVGDGVLVRNRALLGQSRDLRAALGDLRTALPFATDD